MVGRGAGDLVRGEDLVLVGVEDDVLVTRGRVELAVPVGLHVLEGVVHGDGEVGGGGGDGLVAGLVEGGDFGEGEGGPEGLVEEFNRGDGVC